MTSFQIKNIRWSRDTSPPELGRAETISAMDIATNMVMNTTATHPQTTLTGPAKAWLGLLSVDSFQHAGRGVGLREAAPALKSSKAD